jgi:hypothetical protein
MAATIHQKAIAAGFMHALRDPGVFKQWDASKNDLNALAKLVQSTLGLAQTPSAADMEAMRAYTEEHLQDEHAIHQETESRTPHAVGYAFTMQS